LEKSLDRAPRDQAGLPVCRDAGEVEKTATSAVVERASERFARLGAFRHAPRLITVNHRTPVCARDER
jgi:hypothetical protein